MNLLNLFQFQLAACGTNDGILPGLYDGIKCTGGQVDINKVSDILTVLTNVIRILIALSGGLAVIFIIVGGVYYVTSAGDPTRLKRAKEIITQAVTGLVVVLMAYGVVTFIASRF
jgi:hypothetical protein